MKKIITSIVITTLSIACFAQNKVPSEKHLPYRLTTEPAIGTRLSTAMGAMDIQLTNLLQYNISRRVGLISHTAVSHTFPNSRITDVKQNYSYSIMQKFGIGTSLYSKHNIHTFSFLAGVRYNAYSGTLNNDQLPEHITTKAQSTTSDYGLMYNWKKIRNKYFLSFRLYVPLKDGLAGITENATIELGVGIKLK